MVEGSGRGKVGYNKIKFCDEQAARDGLQYFWVDSCCIDKSSSTELSEAINSMFRWYQSAHICFAYVLDVPSGDDLKREHSRFRSGRWFTRGWTLQELLAPRRLHFHDASWSFLGDKISLANVVEEITHIPVEFLSGSNLNNVSVANRMAWASKRRTTRREDIAYCLLGIFDINMPLLYGEGDKAFARLQLEILKETEDESILAWENSLSAVTPTATASCCRLLAPSAADFSIWEGRMLRKVWASVFPSEMTNKGLRIRLPLSYQLGTLCGLLNCASAQGCEEFLALPLQRIGLSDEYKRLHDRKLLRFPFKDEWARHAKYKTIYIKRGNPETYEVPSSVRETGWRQWWDCGWIYIRIPSGFPAKLLDVEPREHWRREWHMIAPGDPLGQVCIWHRTILHFGSPEADDILAADNDFVVILDKQTFWNALCSLKFIPPPFQLYIRCKPHSTTIHSLLSNHDTAALPYVISIGQGNRAVQLNSMALLGRRYYVVDLSCDVPIYSIREQILRHLTKIYRIPSSVSTISTILISVSYLRLFFFRRCFLFSRRIHLDIYALLALPIGQCKSVWCCFVHSNSWPYSTGSVIKHYSK